MRRQHLGATMASLVIVAALWSAAALGQPSTPGAGTPVEPLPTPDTSAAHQPKKSSAHHRARGHAAKSMQGTPASIGPAPDNSTRQTQPAAK